MSHKLIPEYIDPVRYAEQGLSLDGVAKVSDMDRLKTSVHSSDGEVILHLQFGIDEQGIIFLKGRLKTTLSLLCQRCLEPFDYEITSDFALGVVKTLDEANGLPSHYEPALMQEGRLALRELIEDEVMLNLPIISKHEANHCKVEMPQMDSGWKQDQGKNPFQMLESLKDKKQR